MEGRVDLVALDPSLGAPPSVGLSSCELQANAPAREKTAAPKKPEQARGHVRQGSIRPVRKVMRAADGASDLLNSFHHRQGAHADGERRPTSAFLGFESPCSKFCKG
jgi:hypothetical protein